MYLMDWKAFFTVHKGLPREGPGTADDVDWACGLAAVASDTSWEAYYHPMLARIAQLRDSSSQWLEPMLDACTAEADAWRAVRGETGTLLTVARLG